MIITDQPMNGLRESSTSPDVDDLKRAAALILQIPSVETVQVDTERGELVILCPHSSPYLVQQVHRAMALDSLRR